MRWTSRARLLFAVVCALWPSGACTRSSEASPKEPAVAAARASAATAVREHAKPPPAPGEASDAAHTAELARTLSSREVSTLSGKFGATSALLPLGAEDPPASVDAPPEDALRGPGEVRYQIKKRGPAPRSPRADEGLLLRFRVWTSAGLIASTRRFGAEDVAAYRSLDVPEAWAPALAMLEVGDAGRFWLPAAPDAPDPLPAQLMDLELVGTYKPRARRE